MSNNLTEFERLIKGAIDNHSVEYHPTDWIELEHSMDKQKKQRQARTIGFGFFGATVILATSMFFTFSGFEKGDSIAHKDLKNINTNKGNLLNQTDTPNQVSESKDKETFTKLSKTTETTRFTTEKEYVSGTPNNTSTYKANQVSSISNNNRNSSPNNTVSSNDNGSENVDVVSVSNDGGDNNINPTDNSTNNNMHSLSSGENVRVNAHIISSDMSVCVGDDIALRNEETYFQGVIYEWNFGDNFTSDKIKTKHYYDTPGVYNVSLKLRSESTGLILDKDEFKVTVNDLPKTKITWKMVPNEIDNVIQFGYEGKGIQYVEWIFEGENNLHQMNPKYTLKEGTHMVTLLAVNHNGCVSSVSEKITLSNRYNLQAEKEFNAEKESFMPKSLKMLNLPFDMQVFDSTGRLVFQTNDVENPWNGKNYSGLNVEGIYTWKVKLKLKDGGKDIYSGQVRQYKK